MPTPHIEAKVGEIAPTVLLPGDPLRAKYIAENYFDNPKLVSKVRNMLVYTGTINDKPVSIMGTGMGIPSMSICVNELVNEYKCENLIRIGSFGCFDKDVKMGELCIIQASSTDSAYASQYKLNGTLSAVPNYELLAKAKQAADELSIKAHVRPILCSDVFYSATQSQDMWKRWAELGHVGVEMESYGLYTTAAYLNVKALAIATVSDHFITKEVMSSSDRQLKFKEMMEVAIKLVSSL